MTNDPTNPGQPEAEMPKTDAPASPVAALPPPPDADLPDVAPPEQTAAPLVSRFLKGTGVVADDGPKKPATTVTTGTLIMGTYEIEQLINSGGMGEVYRGRNIHNGEPVAIKIVLPSLAHDPKIVALFQKESTTLSRLSHEAIVRYHVFTVDPTIGRPCMVMEFVSGTAMSDRIEQGPMNADDVRVMLRRVASGLDKAHRAGVVHRDLSPDNVILEEGMVEHAKLIDFGIAKSTAMGAGTLLQGQFAGKFNWVAPEQLGAFGGVVDGRSDIYSLALVTAGASRGEVLQMGASIVDAVGKRSSVPDLTGVDAGLVPLLTWMLQPDPALRPENMARVMAALDNPNLIPNSTPPDLKPADPNRTVIGGALPAFDAVAAEVAKSAPPAQNLPSKSKPVSPSWDAPDKSRKSNAPDGATVIADARSFTAPGARAVLPEEEPEDFSPFGAATAPKPPAPDVTSAASIARKKGSGGMILVVAVLLLGIGGAGAYVGGFLGADVTGTIKQTSDEVTTDVVTPVQETTAADAQAAEDAAAKRAEDQAAAAKSAEDQAAAEKIATEQAAAKLANDQAAAKAAAELAAELAKAKAIADAAAAAELAANQTAEEKAAAEKAAAQKAADDAAVAALAATEAAAKKKADDAAAAKAAEVTAAAEAKAAAAAKLAADQAAQKAADDAAAAEKLAAELAEQKAAAEAAKADPLLSQQAFLASYVAPDCVYLGLVDPKPEGFVLDGYASDTKPLETMTKEWTAATTTKPDVAVHLVSAGQCAVLNFAGQFPDTAPKQPLKVVFDNPSAVIKNGSNIKGTVQGLEGRTLTLFYVTAKGTVTNVNKFTIIRDDGTVRFGFTMNIPKASASEPQVFLAIAGDKDIATFLNRLPEGKSAESVFKFVGARLKELSLPTASALAFVQVDN